MPDSRTLLLAVVILICVLLLSRRIINGEKFSIERTEWVVSSVDGLRYRVHEDHFSPSSAADVLATLNARVTEILRWLRRRYLRGEAGAHRPARRAVAARLLDRYNPDNLAENSPRDPGGDTSYTIDKGDVIALCLRARTRGVSPIHDLDTLTFVTLHEMAHIAIEDIDHPPRFWSAFRFLLEAAEASKVYKSQDFAARPERYCGIYIDYNPRWDPNVRAL